MYNADMKTLFLGHLSNENQKNMYASIFKRAAPFEEELDKDIAEFNLDECMNLLIAMCPKSIGHVGVLRSQFIKYVDWAVSNQKGKSNYWSLVPIDDEFASKAFSSRNVKDLESLTKIVDVALTVPYDKYTVYLLYMGIMGEKISELTNIKDEDVDTRKRTITLPRRTFTDIPQPLIDAIERPEYYEESQPRDYDSVYFVKPYNTKKFMGEPVRMKYVYRVIEKLNNRYNETNPSERKHLTPATIWRSGLYRSLYEVEQSKGGIVIDDYSYISEIYGNKNNFSAYQNDYELYKKLFWGNE